MSTLFSLAILSLFLPLKLAMGFIQVRPFDGLAAVLLIWVLLDWRQLSRTFNATPLLALLPYFSWHVISAFTISMSNGVRELIQIFTVIGFVFSACAALPVLKFKKIAYILLIGLSSITLYNIWFHVSHGYMTGWKRLLDPKATFNFLPPILAATVLYARRQVRPALWGAWWAFGILIVLSGDRKALLAFLILSAVLISRGRAVAAAPAFLVTVVAVFSAVLLSNNPYLVNQVYSLLDPIDVRNTYEMIARGGAPTSPSNAQRIFALQASRQMLDEHWLLGVGTNAYVDQLSSRFAYLPRYLRIGIHGEFLRVLVENGIIGLGLMLAAVAGGLVRLRRTLEQLAGEGRIQRTHGTVLATVVLTAPLFYVTFEAGGTHAFVVLSLIVLSSDLLYWTHGGAGQFALPVRRQPKVLPGCAVREAK